MAALAIDVIIGLWPRSRRRSREGSARRPHDRPMLDAASRRPLRLVRDPMGESHGGAGQPVGVEGVRRLRSRQHCVLHRTSYAAMNFSVTAPRAASAKDAPRASRSVSEKRTARPTTRPQSIARLSSHCESSAAPSLPWPRNPTGRHRAPWAATGERDGP